MDFFEVARDGSSPVLEADVASSTNATLKSHFCFLHIFMRDVYKKDLCDVVWDGSPLAKKEFLICKCKKISKNI